MGRRQRFTKEFELEAVRLLEMGQKSPTQLALELGVRRNQLYKWKEQLTEERIMRMLRGAESDANDRCRPSQMFG
jgi:transposase